MLKRTLRKLCIGILFSGIILFNVNADEKSKKDFTFNVIPQLDFGILQLEEDSYLYSPAASIGFKYSKNEEAASGGPDVIAGSLSYGQDVFSKEISGVEEKNFHKLGAFGKVVTGKNTILLKVDGRGAKPFESYKNFEGLLFYARKIIDTDSAQLDIGGGLVATDTGIVIGGIDIFVVPLPMIHFSYKNQIVDAEMEWIGMPDAIITLFPESLFRIHGTFALAGFDLPTDIMGDLALCCYPFREGFMKDIASISVGATHEVKKFRINLNNSLKYDYFTAYGQLSITALTLRGGYAFCGRQTLRSKDGKVTRAYDGGFFLTAQALYKF